MKSKIIKLITYIVIAMFIIAGCSQQDSTGGDSSSSSNSDGPKIAVVLKGSDQEYFKLAEQGARQAFEDLDVNGIFHAATTQTDTTQLINILEDLLIEKPDALVVMPSTEAQIPVLDRYRENDIPVLLIDTDLDWDGKATYIGTDNYSAGREAATYLASLLEKDDKIAVLEGVTGAKVNEDRIAGFEDVMKEEGIEIIASLSADFDRVKAVSAMEDILTAHPYISGIFTANDEMGMGALEAVEARNLDIPIVGVDGTTDGLESISNGGMTATISQDPYNMAYLGVENALKILNGESIEKRIDSGIAIITKENAASELDRVKKLLNK
jgi:ribose transport system substrate-binding protein